MVADSAHRSWYLAPLDHPLALVEETSTQETCSANRAIQAEYARKGIMETTLA
jgi:hypothetical protein